MHTVGEILKKARIEKKLSYEDIEKTLRIRKKFLIALEENTWDKLPSLPYIKGFLRSYSALLELKPEEVIAIFRRQFRHQEKSGLLPDGITKPVNESSVYFTPQSAVVIITLSLITLLFIYLFYQYRGVISPPKLTIISPAEGETILSEKVQIHGITDNDAVVSVNNQKIALTDSGEFTTALTLSPGINTIVVESTSKFGKKKIINRTVQIQSTR